MLSKKYLGSLYYYFQCRFKHLLDRECINYLNLPYRYNHIVDRMSNLCIGCSALNNFSNFDRLDYQIYIKDTCIVLLSFNIICLPYRFSIINSNFNKSDRESRKLSTDNILRNFVWYIKGNFHQNMSCNHSKCYLNRFYSYYCNLCKSSFDYFNNYL